MFSDTLQVLRVADEPLNVPQIEARLNYRFSKYQIARGLRALLGQDLVETVGTSTTKRWIIKQSLAPVVAEPTPEPAPVPEPLFTIEVWADGVRMSHADASRILGSLG